MRSSQSTSTADNRILSEQECYHVLDRLKSLRRGGGQSSLAVASMWAGELRWARNRVSMAGDRRDISVVVVRYVRGGHGSSSTNQLDDESLEGVIRAAERQALEGKREIPHEMKIEPPVFSRLSTTTWSDATFNRTAQANGQLVRRLTQQSEVSGWLSSGYLESQGASIARYDMDAYARESLLYARQTQAQCSVTVRHPKGTGSGWAGLSGYDLATIDEAAIAQRAMDKCRASLNPVRIEPGRYTVILEPQAVADLVTPLMTSEALVRRDAESGKGPFALDYDDSVVRWRSKLGLKVVDERITISHDPADPEQGIIAEGGKLAVTWIKNGVLVALAQNRQRALNELNENLGVEWRAAYRMSGGTTTIDDMIAGTTRGLLVTRFSSPTVLDPNTLLSTGVTRDGLWLIEKGKISKAVQNFRFTESSLFALNNVEQLGVPVSVFNPYQWTSLFALDPSNALRSVIVPPLKVNDFSFTSTTDAV